MIFLTLVQGEGRNCPWLQAKMKVATVLVLSACVSCPWLQEETKEATILGMFKASPQSTVYFLHFNVLSLLLSYPGTFAAL